MGTMSVPLSDGRVTMRYSRPTCQWRRARVTCPQVRVLVDAKETRGEVCCEWRRVVRVRVTCAAGVSSATDLANAYHNINTTAFALEAISSLWNLGMCSSFVGTFSCVSQCALVRPCVACDAVIRSNFGRLAYELAYARTHGRAAPVSMDVFWHAYP